MEVYSTPNISITSKNKAQSLIPNERNLNY